jgi:hypothetical protein
MIKTDSLGDTTLTKRFNNNGQTVFCRDALIFGDRIFIIGSIRDTFTTSISDLLLISFDLDFNLNWLQRFGGSNFDNGIDIKVSHDNKLILAGSRTPEGNNQNPNFYFLKVDLEGNVLWEKSFGVDNATNYCEAFSVCLTSDGGYALSGYSYNYSYEDVNGNIVHDHGDFMIVKTDSLGNEQWRKVYGTTRNENPLFVKELHDKTLLLSGSFEKPNSFDMMGYLGKIRLDGTVIWEKNFDISDNTFFYNEMLENSDGTQIMTGIMVNDQSRPLGALFKFDPLGNLLWKRAYQESSICDQYIYDIIPSENGGFVFCGSACDDVAQRGWVVKTDCFGCDSTLCYFGETACEVYDCSLHPINANFTQSHLTVHLEDQEEVFFHNYSQNATNIYWTFGDGTNAYTDSLVSHLYSEAGVYEVQAIVYHGTCSDTMTKTVVVTSDLGYNENTLSKLISIYPNPNQGNFTLKNNTNKAVNILIMDATGREVYSNNTQLTSNEISLNPNLKNGIYFIRLFNSEFGYQEKISVQK